MSKRPLSNTPSAVEARERRFYAEIDRQEAKFHAEVRNLMVARGLTFDEAFVACGGTIVDDEKIKKATLVSKIMAALDKVGA